MDDLSETLSTLLSSPEGMARVRDLAQTLLGEQETPPEPAKADAKNAGEATGDGFALGAGELAALRRAAGLLREQPEDDRTRLLLALKPHLSEERRARVDRAVRMLQLLRLAPLLQEGGFLPF